MKIIFYGTREYDHYYFDVLAADPEYGCEIRFLTANLDADTAPLAQGGDAVCAFVNADCSAPVLEKLAQVGIRCLLLRCAGYNNVDLAAAQKCGITVLRVPGYSPEAVAEHAMALAQAANRRICKAISRCATTTLRWTVCWGTTCTARRRALWAQGASARPWRASVTGLA